MNKPRLETVIEHYRVTRRDNFAASQRLEGIKTPATVDNDQSPLPSKEALRKANSTPIRNAFEDLLDEVCDWAGMLRTVDIAKGTTRF
ncbi:YhfG family protein [Xanthomonas oryzae]|uniref:YhfG family protein n=1 Tax=Xanthomonas oryzae TaxID=347 RepID=UPI0008663E90|nr:YhfG family protein [Xanthomonas oryzae]AOS05352.1 hypothetical protein ATY43_03450 [Xanthomonas oryzae pv. oryzae]